jgi:transposase-like protein
MSVELLDSSRFHGFRVRRQIEGKTYQEYFSLKVGGRRLRGDKRAAVRLRSETRDGELAQRQRAARDKAAKAVHIYAQGQIRGILCRLKAEKSGTMTPVFQIGVMSQLTDKIVNTTVSINKYGVESAWRRAVDFFVAHKGISKRSRAYRDLLAAQPTEAQARRLTRPRGNTRTSDRSGNKHQTNA